MAAPPQRRPNPAKIADEQATVLDLRRKGLSVRRIATELNMAKSTVQERLDAAIAELVLPLADEVRQLELERLDAWQVRLEERLEDGEAAERIIPIGLKVQERRSKYLGLDAPERSELTATVLPAADDAVEELLSQARGETP